jgi:hypothetical protein
MDLKSRWLNQPMSNKSRMLWSKSVCLLSRTGFEFIAKTMIMDLKKTGLSGWHPPYAVRVAPRTEALTHEHANVL